MKKFIGLFSTIMLLPALVDGKRKAEGSREKHVYFKQMGYGSIKVKSSSEHEITWCSSDKNTEQNITKNGKYCGMFCMGESREAGCPMSNQQNNPCSRSLKVCIKADENGLKFKERHPASNKKLTYCVELDRDLIDTAKKTGYPITFLLGSGSESPSKEEKSSETDANPVVEAQSKKVKNKKGSKKQKLNPALSGAVEPAAEPAQSASPAAAVVTPGPSAAPVAASTAPATVAAAVSPVVQPTQTELPKAEPAAIPAGPVATS